MSPLKKTLHFIFSDCFLALFLWCVWIRSVSRWNIINDLVLLCVGGAFWDWDSLRAHIGLEPSGLPVFSFFSTLIPECIGYFSLEYGQTIVFFKRSCVCIYDMSFSMDMVVIWFTCRGQRTVLGSILSSIMWSGGETRTVWFVPQVLCHHTGPCVIKPLLKVFLIHLFFF